MKDNKNQYNPYALAYLVIPDYAFKDDRLTLIALKVYGFIHSYTNPFFFGNENIAKMFNCSERSITEALSKLEEYGYIKMKYTPKAGGGTTRLAVDFQSDSQSSSSRKKNSEATTSSLLLHKDIKDNNKKEKISKTYITENDMELNPDLDLLTEKYSKEKKPSINTPNWKPQKKYENKPKKKGVDATNIV